MGKRGLRSWMRRRLAHRLEKKLDLDDAQAAELQSIMSGWHSAHTMWGQSMNGTTLSGEQEGLPLSALIQSGVEAYKRKLDEQSIKLIDFAGGLNPLQQQRAIALLAKPRHFCR